MNQTDVIAPPVTASPRLRVTFAVGAAVMLALWGWGLDPIIENWNNPNEDGFSAVPAFYGTIFCLPPALFMLAGAVSGRARAVSRARIALFVGGGVLFIVIAFIIFAWADQKFGLGFG